MEDDNKEPKIVVESLDVEGVERRVWKKELEDGSRMYSFDNQASWHHTLVEAYRFARDNDALVSADGISDSDASDEFQVFMIALMNEICRLKTGEHLKIVRDRDRTYVVREEVSVACGNDSLAEVKLGVMDAE